MCARPRAEMARAAAAAAVAIAALAAAAAAAPVDSGCVRAGARQASPSLAGGGGPDTLRRAAAQS